jgi:hypothetical protein
MKGKYTHVILPKIDYVVSSDSATKDSAKKNYWGLIDSDLFEIKHNTFIPTEMQ